MHVIWYYYNLSDANRQRYYNFVHFSFQEYLAVYHLKNKFTFKQTSKLYLKIWQIRYFGIWKMYAGITKGEQFPLQQFLSGKNLKLSISIVITTILIIIVLFVHDCM